MEYKENFDEAREHFEAFWNVDYLNRCNLCITIQKPNMTGYTPKSFTLKERYTNPEIINEIMEENYSKTEFLFESLPSNYVNFGTAGHSAYFGCKPNYARDTIWFDPILKEPSAHKLVFDKEGRSQFEWQKGVVKKLGELAAGKYLTSMPDNCGIIDCLAEIRGTDNLLVDMIENPDFVHESRDKITEAWKETQGEFFSLLNENNYGGSSHGWMQLWSPLRHTQIQCDFSVMISPEMFEEFILPELESTAKAFEHTTYHLDGVEQLRRLDMILSVKEINNIQWTPVAGQPLTSNSIESLKKIQQAGKGLVLIPQLSEAEFLMRNLSHKGLHLILGAVKNREEAAAIEKIAVDSAH